ncbi:MAG: Spx/MgsR family RNA polymerase-binding regulatory protein [Opitutus sp.]|nr:Spx/MgsR family RNA polymerase-binding regulatory protein [Opitutus sp.]
MIAVYTLAQCSTCKAAVKWLQAHDIPFRERAIRETPPSGAELATMLTAQNGELRKLFNTSGRDYREQQLAAILPTLTIREALQLLESNGNLVKRPFVIGPGVALVGFNAVKWKQALVKK